MYICSHNVFACICNYKDICMQAFGNENMKTFSLSIYIYIYIYLFEIKYSYNSFGETLLKNLMRGLHKVTSFN